jgi:hypothetical protein
MAEIQRPKNGRLIAHAQTIIVAGMVVVLVLVGFVRVPTASAEVFESRFLRFSLPEGWKCDLEGSEYVCEPPHPKGQKQSMIFVLAAKYPNDSDNLPGYMEELRRNKSMTHGSSLVDGPKIDSNINGLSWVEATHFESELQGYYTIYMATVSNGLAVLVTFSVRRNEYMRFRDLVRPCIESLEVKKNWRSPPSVPKHK